MLTSQVELGQKLDALKSGEQLSLTGRILELLFGVDDGTLGNDPIKVARAFGVAHGCAFLPNKCGDESATFTKVTSSPAG